MTQVGASGNSRELRALLWTTLAAVGSAAMTIGRSALLARLLSPDDFGLFGLVFFAVTAIAALTELGLWRFMIVARFDDAATEHRFLHTVWTWQVLRGLVLMALVAGLAPLYAQSLRLPQLTPLLLVSSASLLISALGSPASSLLYRRLEQRPLALVRLGSELFGLLVTAVLAWRAPSAWALVTGWLAGVGLATLLSYAIHPYRPRLALDRALFSRGLAQSRYIAVVAVMTFVTTQVDNYLVGRILGPASLGLYLFAYRIAALPVDMLQTIVSAVAMPSYSHYRDAGAPVLLEKLRRVMVPTMAVLCAGVVVAVLLRGELVALLGGERWTAAVPLLIPLLLVAVLRSAAIQLGTLLQSVGRAELDAYGKCVEAVLFIPGCALAVIAWGLQGACWAGVAVYALAVLLRTVGVGHVLPGQRMVVTMDWVSCALPAALCAGAGLLAGRAGAPSLLIAPVALAVYGVIVSRLHPQLLRQLAALRAGSH
jgi:O-antigen/teichoic acid export membrane protein